MPAAQAAAVAEEVGRTAVRISILRSILLTVVAQALIGLTIWLGKLHSAWRASRSRSWPDSANRRMAAITSKSIRSGALSTWSTIASTAAEASVESMAKSTTTEASTTSLAFVAVSANSFSPGDVETPPGALTPLSEHRTCKSHVLGPRVMLQVDLGAPAPLTGCSPLHRR